MTNVALGLLWDVCAHVNFSQFNLKNKVFFSFVKIWNKTDFCNRWTGHFLSSSSFGHFTHLYGSVQDWDKTTSSWQHFFASILFSTCSASLGGDMMKMKDNSSDWWIDQKDKTSDPISVQHRNLYNEIKKTQKTNSHDYSQQYNQESLS